MFFECSENSGRLKYLLEVLVTFHALGYLWAVAGAPCMGLYASKVPRT